MTKQIECDREQEEKTVKDQILLNTSVYVIKNIIKSIL